MRKGTEAMHRAVGTAITELRRTLNWSQGELAQHIGKHGTCGRAMQEPAIEMISKWEHGSRSPAPEYRAALARIAAKRKETRELEPIFLASATTWRVVSRVESLRASPAGNPSRDEDMQP